MTSADPIRVTVPTTIHLALSVGNVRSDGYHDVVAIQHAVDVYHQVTVTDAPTYAMSGPDGQPARLGAQHLVEQAVTALAAHLGRQRSAHVTIGHNPLAGRATPSRDAARTGHRAALAAAALVGCHRLWGATLSRAELADIGATVHPHIPFSLTGGTAVATGRGERLTPVMARTPLHWVLADARRPLTARDVYAEFDRLRDNGGPAHTERPERMLAALASSDPEQIAPRLVNDLQAAAISLLPDLRRTLRAGLDAGALGGIVAGPGSLIAFLASSAEAATDVAAELAGSGTCDVVRVASGPVGGARMVEQT